MTRLLALQLSSVAERSTLIVVAEDAKYAALPGKPQAACHSLASAPCPLARCRAYANRAANRGRTWLRHGSRADGAARNGHGCCLGWAAMGWTGPGTGDGRGIRGERGARRAPAAERAGAG